MNSIEFIKEAKKGKIDIVKNTKKTLVEIKKINKEYNFFITVDVKHSLEQAKNVKKGRLYGLPISIKDCICVKDMETKSSSKILEGYKPVFDSTVVQKIKKEGGIIIGKTTQDVFGFGSFNTNVGLGYKKPKNPFDKKRATGGSSGGAAGITQKVDTHIAIAESTGGSITCPAAYCGVYGITPTYGRVSRYGLIDYANSMDKIGVMAKNIEEIALMMEIISGYDERDSTSVKKEVPNFTRQEHSKFKVALLENFMGEGVQKRVKNNLVDSLREVDYKKEKLPLTFKYGIPCYYLLSMSEASTNLAKLSGMRYGYELPVKGNFNEYFSKVRSKAFSKEAKRRIILGTFARMTGFRDAFYLQALKVRTKIIQEYKKLFKKYDLLVTPSMPNIAPKFSQIEKLSPLENFMMDIMTVGPNLAGLPHLTIPTGFSNKMPTGMQVIADHFEEQKLIDFARCLKLEGGV